MASVNETWGEITMLEERPYIEAKRGFTPFVENDVLFAKITPSMENGKAAIARDSPERRRLWIYGVPCPQVHGI